MKPIEFKVKIVVSGLLFALVLGFPAVSVSQTTDPAVLAFRKNVDRILSHPCLKRKNFGISIYSLDREKALYSTRNEKLFIPASNVKLITSAAALKYLGPNYRFYTRLFTSGKILGDTLYGDIYLKGFGDPKLVSEQMWLLVNKLVNLPIRKIKGDIIADATFFDDRLRVKTWESKGGSEAYKAPLGALSFNFNTVTVYVSPSLKPGTLPLVIVEPQTDYIFVNNQARTLSRGKKSRLIVHRVDRDSYDEVMVSGKISQGHPRQRYFLNITHPTQYTANVFREYLAIAGIKTKAIVREGKVPPDAQLLISHKSEPLSLALRGLNKFSNNFVAEQILKTLGAEQFGPPGTTENGLKVLKNYMQSLGYSVGDFILVDGSGLSKPNRLSPDQLIGVLSQMQDDLSVFPEFISALGVMSVDGNVRKRLNGVDQAQKVRVKTGTLRGVSALSGYFQSLDGENFAFSFLMNDLRCPVFRATKIQDRIIQEGLRFKRGELKLRSDPQ